MPMLHIVGVTSFNKNFEMGYAFLAGEMEVDYLFIIMALKELCEQLGVRPHVFVTDKEEAIKNALTQCFPGVKQVLCR
jgi:hypothetical protein